MYRKLGARDPRARRCARRLLRPRLEPPPAWPPDVGGRACAGDLGGGGHRRCRGRRPGGGGARDRGDPPPRGPAGALLQGGPRRGRPRQRGGHGRGVRGGPEPRPAPPRLRELHRRPRRAGGERLRLHPLRRLQGLRRSDRPDLLAGLGGAEHRAPPWHRLRRRPRPGHDVEDHGRDPGGGGRARLRGALHRRHLVSLRGRGRGGVPPGHRAGRRRRACLRLQRDRHPDRGWA